MKLATITRLIAEIGDCEELQLTLDDMVANLEGLKRGVYSPKVRETDLFADILASVTDYDSEEEEEVASAEKEVEVEVASAEVKAPMCMTCSVSSYCAWCDRKVASAEDKAPMCIKCEINPSAKKNSLSSHYGCEDGGQEDCGSCKNPYFWNLCDFCHDKEAEEEDIDDITCDCCEGIIEEEFNRLYGKRGLKIPANQETCDCQECFECGDRFHEKDMKKTEQGDLFCSKCYEENYIECDNCCEECNREDDDCVEVTLLRKNDKGETMFICRRPFCFECFQDEYADGLTNNKKGEYCEIWYGGDLTKSDMEDYQKYSKPHEEDEESDEE